MVGNERDAMQTWQGEWIGEGCSRAVYRFGDVVYKVNITEFNSNLDEYLAGERLRDNVPSPFVVPPMTLYGDVLAMPFYDGIMSGECHCLPVETCDETCMSPELVDTCYTIGQDIATWGNTISHDGIVYLIDLGSES